MFETKMMRLEFKELTKKAFGLTKKQQRREINDETRVGNEKKTENSFFRFFNLRIFVNFFNIGNSSIHNEDFVVII